MTENVWVGHNEAEDVKPKQNNKQFAKGNGKLDSCQQVNTMRCLFGQFWLKPPAWLFYCFSLLYFSCVTAKNFITLFRAVLYILYKA